MGVNHPGRGMSDEQQRQIRQQATATIQNAGVGRDGIRVHDGGWIRIEGGGLSVTGTATVSGDLDVTGEETVSGTLTVTGHLNGNGDIDWTGPSIFRGTVNVTGNSAFSGTLNIGGATTIDGATTLNSTLTVGTGQILAGDVTITPTGGGRVQVGNVIIDGGGSSGGRVYSASQLELSGASGVRVIGPMTTSDQIVLGKVTAAELFISGAKTFSMPHPAKPGYMLRHGSTESPISGTEYTGRVTLGDDGSAVVELPDYFEALNKPENRTVQLTPVGRPFGFGADEVIDGKVTLYGEPGRDLFWLVKAERFGGDFEVEQLIPAEDQ